ncbi:MAG TPA: biotin/lipoyl-containing protein, partial [Trebonia sp.]|nr:biotin/lipoyl-containing protein [Trebonia sp.]
MKKEFRLPDVGEGLTEADIVNWRVKAGDTVTVNQVIVEIETAKSLVELPSPWAGTVSRLLVEESSTVDVGVPIIEIEVPGAAGGPAGSAPASSAPGSSAPGSSAPGAEAPAAATAAAASPAPQAPAAPPAPPERTPVLVGYGVRPSATSRRPRRDSSTRPGSYPASPAYPPGPAARPPVPARPEAPA